MSDPKNASLNGDGFRFYRWEDAATGETTDVLSVTSIRKLCGEPYNLVNWQIANVIDVAMSTMKRTIIGPKGGVSEKRLKDEFPGEFARRYAASDGEQGKLDDLRKWVREQADQPRNVAAVRGTMAHAAIEKNVEWDRIERPYVEAAFAELSSRDRARVKEGVQDEDVLFVRNSVRQYWDMRNAVPMVIIARELQTFNLEAGYAGTFDALAWVLPDDMPNPLPKARDITLELVKRLGGELVLLDWKTSKGIYTDQVIQLHAYLSAEFVGSDGIIDHRLSDLLLATKKAALVHIRPNGWGIHSFDYQEEAVRAFLGSCAFARFLARYSEPWALFSNTIKGESEESEEAVA